MKTADEVVEVYALALKKALAYRGVLAESIAKQLLAESAAELGEKKPLVEIKSNIPADFYPSDA